MQYVRIGSLEVSRFIVGSNPISGFSHQTRELDMRMRHYFSSAQIKRLLRQAESLGVNTLIARGDHHVMRLLMEYWDEGGKIQWIAQTCPELGAIERGVQNAIAGGAKACFVHGGVMDNLLANGKLDEVPPAIEMIKAAGMPAGVAGHRPESHVWARDNLDLDFHMCSYYNPSDRSQNAENTGASHELYDDRDRDAMVEVLATIQRPVIHYKVFAAGRKTPEEAFGFVAQHFRATDAVCIGIYDEDKPDMLRQNAELIERHLLR